MHLYKTIVVDPPWPQGLSGKRRRVKGEHSGETLPYETMTLAEIMRLPVRLLADDDAHLWLWTTNEFLGDGITLMRSWGFQYLAPIHWVRPSGMGNYFVHRTQTVLFGYRKRCVFPLRRYAPNIIEAPIPTEHSRKPEESYSLIESISPEPRVELFARRTRPGWDVWGNEVESSIEFIAANSPALTAGAGRE